MLLEVVSEMDPTRAIVTDETRTLTTAEVRAGALRLACRLDELEHDGPVAFIGVNSVAVPVAMFGAAFAGRAFAPLNFRADRALVAHFLAVLEPAIVICADRYREVLPAGTRAWSIDSLLEGDRSQAEAVAAEAAGAAVHIFTSGTSAAPKAASLRHAHLLSYVLGSIEPLSEPAEAATLVSAPNYHIATVVNLLTSTFAGRRVVLMERFDPVEWLTMARRERVTHAFVVPTMLQRLVDAIDAGAEPPTTLRTLAYGGSAAARSTVEAALAAFPAGTGFVNAYGLTETSSTISVLTPDDHRAAITSEDPEAQARLVSVGRPLPGVEVRIDGGEILVRGAQVSGEYRGRDGAEGEWFRTGDLGRLDDEGFLFIEGRKDDMIIRGGENISPVEIEDVLCRHPAVATAAAVGVSDTEWGQRVQAAVELVADAAPEDIATFAAQFLPSFKRPDRVVILDELPRNDLGKLQRRRVRAMLEADESQPA
jgi:acyl-CoA synthetase (AMP-forming)/AMP-acid ligase II